MATVTYVVGYKNGRGEVKLLPGYQGLTWDSPAEAIQYSEDDLEHLVDVAVYRVIPWCDMEGHLL